MMNDDEIPTPEQSQQIATGQYVALSAAVHALIASHPNPAEFARLFRHYDQETQRLFLALPVMQAENGMRLAYGEVRRSLLAAIPPH